MQRHQSNVQNSTQSFGASQPRPALSLLQSYRNGSGDDEGPGLIAGASDDNPSGIGTYGQAGRRHRMDDADHIPAGDLLVTGPVYWLG